MKMLNDDIHENVLINASEIYLFQVNINVYYAYYEDHIHQAELKDIHHENL